MQRRGDCEGERSAAVLPGGGLDEIHQLLQGADNATGEPPPTHREEHKYTKTDAHELDRFCRTHGIGALLVRSDLFACPPHDLVNSGVVRLVIRLQDAPGEGLSFLSVSLYHKGKKFVVPDSEERHCQLVRFDSQHLL